MLGQVLMGQYQVARRLGEGNMGQVYLAKQKDNGRLVVVKVMNDEIADQPKFRELFEREMQFMARFQHPHVVELYDSSPRNSDKLFIVMEYVKGNDLEQLLQIEKRFPPDRVGIWLGQLCSALQSAHADGIIHRDLKPANIMIVEADTPNEHLKVMDFGLAKLADSVHISLDRLKGSDLTLATGTPEYIAPEQVRGDEVDHRSDIYSLGVILFELLTGKLPFQRRTIGDMLDAHANDPPPSFASIGVADISKDLEFVVQTCLCKYPVERPEDAFDLAQRFQRALGMKIMEEVEVPAGIEETAPPPEDPPRPPPDEDANVYNLEAWMPEPIAVVKLRGYVEDVGGEVVESIPGKIKVLFGKPGCKYQVSVRKKAPPKKGPLSWLGLGPEPGTQNKLFEMELLLEKKRDARQNTVLAITMLIKPEGGGPLPRNPDWHACCDLIYKDLRAYVMGKS